MARADRKLFRLLEDDVCRELLECLLGRDGPRTQRQLSEALDLTSSTVSRRIRQLEDDGLVEQLGRRGPYAVAFAAETRGLLEGALELAKLISASQSEKAQEQYANLRKEGLAGGHLHDRAGESG